MWLQSMRVKKRKPLSLDKMHEVDRKGKCHAEKRWCEIVSIQAKR